MLSLPLYILLLATETVVIIIVGCVIVIIVCGVIIYRAVTKGASPDQPTPEPEDTEPEDEPVYLNTIRAANKPELFTIAFIVNPSYVNHEAYFRLQVAPKTAPGPNDAIDYSGAKVELEIAGGGTCSAISDMVMNPDTGLPGDYTGGFIRKDIPANGEIAVKIIATAPQGSDTLTANIQNSPDSPVSTQYEVRGN